MRTLFRRIIKLLVLAGLFACGLILFTARPIVFSRRDPSLVPFGQPERIRADIQKLVSDWGPRNAESAEKLGQVADFLISALRATNTRVSLQSFFVGGVDFENVIAEHGFPSEAGTVVIGAHYDTAPETPGADDNATGVSAILELNRLFAESPPRTKVILALYPLEELPPSQATDMGSFIHATELRKSKERVRLMISLESLGYFSDTDGSQRYPLEVLSWLYPGRGDFLAIVGEASLSPATVRLKSAFARATDLRVASINAPRFIEGVSFSDHKSFWAQGFDAVMLTDTALFRNPHYHKPSDLPETVDATKVAQVVDGLMAYLDGLAPKNRN